MSGFTIDWLRMRAPFDRQARNRDVLARVAQHFAHLPSLTVVDLGCGLGATREALAPHLPRPQHWLLADNDLSLLARAAAAPDIDGCDTRAVPIDLARDLEAVLDGAPDLIATSALLDLVSQPWLDRLVLECQVRSLPLYAALTYDGRVSLTPRDPLDDAIIAATHRHHTRNKGFGPALGPGAVDALRAACRAAGYAVVEGASDWTIGPDARVMQETLAAWWAGAAQETGEVAMPDVAAWLMRRRDLIAAGRSAMTVGHHDVFAHPLPAR